MKLSADDPKLLFFLCASSVILAVVLIFGFIVLTALPVIRMSGLYLIFGSTWDYNTHQFGMLTLITGSLFLVAITLLLATPMGILAAIYLAEYAPPALEKTFRALIELLVGIPSVVYGIFGFLLLEPIFQSLVKPGIGSLLGFLPLFRNVTPNTGSGYLLAASVLSIMILPTIISLSHESLRAVPSGYREASLALGIAEWRTIVQIILRTALKGIVTGVLLALARVAGETAPLLFTAFGNRFWNHSLSDPIAALPLQIFNYAVSPYDDWHRQAWAGAFVLLLLITVIDVSVRFLTRDRFQKST